MPRRALFVIFVVAFFDSAAYGIVHPLFSRMLFGAASTFLAPEVSDFVRGVWLGVLVATTPVVQLLVSPFVGAVSDRVGRRPVMLSCLVFGSLGFFSAAFFIRNGYLPGVVFGRILSGISVASFTVANACISEVCSMEEKGRAFPWLSMAFGLGGAIGPFLGGFLSEGSCFSTHNFSRPFIVSGCAELAIFALVALLLPETRPAAGNLKGGRDASDRLVLDPVIRRLLVATFLFCFGWTFYIDVIPVWWVQALRLTTWEVGTTFSLGAVFYVVACGAFVGPVLARYAPIRVLWVTSLLLSISTLAVVFFHSRQAFLLMLPIQNCLVAFLFPVAATAVSMLASEDQQGKIMGCYASAECLGVGLGPLVSGVFLSVHPLMPAFIGGLAIFACHLCVRPLLARLEAA